MSAIKKEDKRKKTAPGHKAGVFFDAVQKSFVESGRMIWDRICGLSETDSPEEKERRDLKFKHMTTTVKQTLKDTRQTFRKNFKNVTFKSALLDSSYELGYFVRTARKFGSKFLNDLVE